MARAPQVPLWVPGNVASSGTFSGFLRENSTMGKSETPIKWGVSACAERERSVPTAKAAPTALRPQATCPTCHSGICQGFSPSLCQQVGQGHFRGLTKKVGRIRGQAQMNRQAPSRQQPCIQGDTIPPSPSTSRTVYSSGASAERCAWPSRGGDALARCQCVYDDSRTLSGTNHHMTAD